MLRRISALSLAILGSVLFCCGQFAKADTITLTTQSYSTVTGVYTYGVNFTATSKVVSGDGYVVFDFPDVTGATFTWSASSAATLLANSINPATAIFTPEISLLYNYINAAPGPSAPTSTPNALDAQLVTTLHMTDNATIDNLSMVYSGPTITALGPLSGTLTIDTGLMGSGATTGLAGYGSKDSGGGIYADSVIVVAAGGSSVPLPASVVGGGLLMSLVGIAGMMKKTRLWPAARI
jgi:hypothetical protein